MSENASLNSSSSVISEESRKSRHGYPPGVAGVPIRILEALHHIRELQKQTKDEHVRKEMAEVNSLLSPCIETMADAVEQLAKVA